MAIFCYSAFWVSAHLGYSYLNWLNIDDSSTFIESDSECTTTNISKNYSPGICVFPNPTSNIVYIEPSKKISIIKVFNDLGQQVLEKNGVNKINLSEKPDGLYYIYIEDINGSNETYKIIKE